MKLLSCAIAALLVTAFAPHANAQAPVTYSVIKASASIPVYLQAADGATLLKFTFTTKSLINMGLNQDLNTPVPKNIILGFAGNFDDFGHNTPNTAGPVRLVVFDTQDPKDPLDGEKKATIAIAANRSMIENRFFNKFKRVAVTTLTVQDTSGGGAVVSAFSGGTLQIGGITTRGPNIAGPMPLDKLKVGTTTTVVGILNGFYTQGTKSALGPFLVTKGAIKASGKIVGQFTE